MCDVKGQVKQRILERKRKKRLIEQRHKLLLVSGGGLALTRSYSERWQVARGDRAVWPWCSVRRA